MKEFSLYDFENLPVQYALMPIYEKTGRGLLGYDYALSAYIVAKCVVKARYDKTAVDF